MYVKIGGRQFALVCFKGTEGEIENTHPRGRIVPFPQWGEVDWFRCVKQLQPYSGSITLPTGTRLVGPDERAGCTTYLMMERCKSYSFRSKGGTSFGAEDDGDEGDYWGAACSCTAVVC